MPKPTPKNHQKLYIWIASLAVAIPVLCICLFMLLVFQVPQYSYYYVKCGFGAPVKVVGRDFGGEMLNYTTPLDSGYKDEALAVRGYFCTEDEAQKAGLKSLYGGDGWFNPDSTPSSQVKW